MREKNKIKWRKKKFVRKLTIVWFGRWPGGQSRDQNRCLSQNRNGFDDALDFEISRVIVVATQHSMLGCLTVTTANIHICRPIKFNKRFSNRLICDWMMGRWRICVAHDSVTDDGRCARGSRQTLYGRCEGWWIWYGWARIRPTHSWSVNIRNWSMTDCRAVMITANYASSIGAY